MLRPQGYATISDPDTGLTERDTMTCAHCNAMKHIKPKTDPADMGGLCKLCMGLICAKCVGKPCVPFMERVDRLEKAIEKGREIESWWRCAEAEAIK